MKFQADNIARKSISGLKPYSTARNEFMGSASIYMDANENPFDSELNRYPDPRQIQLKDAIGSLKDIKSQQIILGNGSDEIIDLLIRVFCEPSLDNIIIPQPTYGMYSVCASINNVEVKQPRLASNFDLDIPAIKDSIDPNTKIIFLCSPNNPSGNLLNVEKIKLLLRSFQGLVVVDEAYIDFAETNSLLPQLNQFPNLVVLQTFSKAWGLAGIRLGVGYASPGIIQILSKIKLPYNINSITQVTALKALSNKTQKDNWVELIKLERTELEIKLPQFSFVKKVFSSQANFLLTQIDNAKACYKFLMAEGIIVRDRSSTVGCENCLRITVGTPQENKTLIDALKNYEKSIVY